jgi:acetyltransferase-like isoleucine patch superfamily enzyme
MAIRKFNAVAGISVGDDVIFEVIDNSANITANNLSVSANTTTGNLVVTSFVSSNLTPNTNVTHSLGNTAFRWLTINSQDGDFSRDINVTRNVSIGGNTAIGNNATVANNLTASNNITSGNNLFVGANSTVTNSGSFGDNLSVGEVLTVTGNSSITGVLTTNTSLVTISSNTKLSGATNTVDNNLTVNNNLTVANTINGFQVIGVKSSANTAANTIIDSFPVGKTKGFKYVIHGENELANSAFAVEIVGSHNSANVFFTRYGEISNSFTAELFLRISSGNVLLEAKCDSASSTNVHSFNIIRFETR